MMPSKQNNDISLDKDMTLTEHLQELRSCLIKSIAALIIGTGISAYFLQSIIDVLTSAAKELYYMRPAEAFMIYMKVALLSGLILSSPFILYELYGFIRPALTPRERRFTLICIPLALVLFITGLLFSYSFVFPRGLEFFLGFAAGKVNPLICRPLRLCLQRACHFNAAGLPQYHQLQNAHALPAPRHPRRLHHCRHYHAYTGYYYADAAGCAADTAI